MGYWWVFRDCEEGKEGLGVVIREVKKNLGCGMSKFCKKKLRSG
jgi:hypothetical protein